MGRPTKTSDLLFTSRELAVAADLSARNMSLLHDEGLAPAVTEAGAGRGGHRLYSSIAVAHAALIGALHLAGFELLVSARLAEAVADDFAAMYGKLHANLSVFLQAPYNSTPGRRPWTDDDSIPQLDDDFWVYNRLIDSPVDLRPGTAIPGDMIIDIADHEYVLTETHGSRGIKIFSPVMKEGLPASPDYRIVGRGSAARIVPITDEVDTMDFTVDPASAARYRALQEDYLAARENAVTRVRINVSLAIRNAFGRLRQDRTRIAA